MSLLEREGEPIVQYDEPHTAGRDRRGILLYSLQPEPTVALEELMAGFKTYRAAMNPNVVRFHMPNHVRTHHWRRAQAELEEAFAKSFPGRELATICLVESAIGYRNIDIETPFDNVKADDIISAAAEHRWKVGFAPLGPPQFVGFQSSAFLHPVKIDDIPLDLVNEFVDDLPAFFRDFNPDPVKIRVVDVWRVEGKVMTKAIGSDERESNWIHLNSIAVLIEFTKLPAPGRICDVVHSWPGWVLWKRKLNVHLAFPGRFDYCQFCKYHAQDLEGEHKRHWIGDCPKVECSRCGCRGHFDSFCRSKRPWKQYNHQDGGIDNRYYHFGRAVSFNDDMTEDDDHANGTINRNEYGSNDYWRSRTRRAVGLAETKALIVQALSQDKEAEEDKKGGDGKQSNARELDDNEEVNFPGAYPFNTLSRKNDLVRF